MGMLPKVKLLDLNASISCAEYCTIGSSHVLLTPGVPGAPVGFALPGVAGGCKEPCWKGLAWVNGDALAFALLPKALAGAAGAVEACPNGFAAAAAGAADCPKGLAPAGAAWPKGLGAFAGADWPC